VDGGNALGQRHFINCNSTIDCTYAGFLEEQPPQPFTSWPAYLIGGFNMYSHRQERAQQIWNETSLAVNWSFMYRMSMDKKNGFAAHNLPDLFAADDAWHDYAADPGTLGSAMNILKGWNMLSSSDSEAMYLFKLWIRKFTKAGPYSKYFILPSNRPAFDLNDSVLCLDALNALIDAYHIWVEKTGPGERTWGHNHRIMRQLETGMLSWPVSGDSCCLRSAYGPFKKTGPGSGNFEDHIEVEGGQIIPMIIRMNLNGPPLIRCMKAFDNCTVHASRLYNPACPSTVDWVHEKYGDL
jgi:hypothetical protein